MIDQRTQTIPHSLDGSTAVRCYASFRDPKAYFSRSLASSTRGWKMALENLSNIDRHSVIQSRSKFANAPSRCNLISDWFENSCIWDGIFPLALRIIDAFKGFTSTDLYLTALGPLYPSPHIMSYNEGSGHSIALPMLNDAIVSSVIVPYFFSLDLFLG